MSAAAYFLKKCADKVAENISLALSKMSEPITISGSGADALAAAAAGDMGPLKSLAEDYIKANADVLLLKALEVTGLESTVLGALNLFFNMLAQAVSAYNNLILMFMKNLAEKIIVELDKKEISNQKLKQDLTNLLNGLLVLTSGDPVFDAYLRQLREALIDLNSGKNDIVAVRNAIQRDGRFLGKRYKRGKETITIAAEKIKPLADNPYLEPTASALAMNLGLPSTEAQINNLLAIPALCLNVIEGIEVYGAQVAKINAMLVAYYSSLNVLQVGMPDVLKKYLLSRFNSTLQKLQTLINSMALNLNGDEGAIFGPVDGFKVTPLNVSVQAFKWSMDVSLVQESFKLIPSGHVVLERQNNGVALAQPNGKILQAPTQDYFKNVLTGDQVEIFSGLPRTGTYRVKNKISDNQLELDRVLNNSIQTVSPVEYEITTDSLGAFQLQQGAVDAFVQSVNNLKSLGTVSSGSAALIANEAQEDVAIFAGQLLVFLLKATNAVVSNTMEQAAISQARGFIKRCDLVTERDAVIKSYLQAFIDYPIDDEGALSALFDGLKSALKSMGLDKMADMLDEGKFQEMFGADSKSATYIGAALLAISLLKECFDNEADQAALSEIENEIQADADLINIKISFDFDLAILKNIEDCLNLNALAGMLNAKELICGLLEAAGVGSLFTKLKDLLSF